jgi:hypothetical protein
VRSAAGGLQNMQFHLHRQSKAPVDWSMPPKKAIRLRLKRHENTAAGLAVSSHLYGKQLLMIRHAMR